MLMITIEKDDAKTKDDVKTEHGEIVYKVHN